MTKQDFEILMNSLYSNNQLFIPQGQNIKEWINNAFVENQDEAINYTPCCTELPTSTQLLSDCKKRFKELEGKGSLDYRSYMNGYLDSFSKNVVSKIK